MIIDIRGRMGHQVIEAFVGIAKCIENSTDPTFIVVNTDDHTNTVERLTDIFRMGDGIGILAKPGTKKQNCWTHENIMLAFKHRDEILKNYLHFKYPNDYMELPTRNIFHVRGNDKQIISDTNYIALARLICQKHGVPMMMGDDKGLMNTIQGDVTKMSMSYSRDLHDWCSILESDKTFAGLSSFVFSTLLINPNISMEIFPPQYCDSLHLHKVDFEPVDAFMCHCPNLEYFSDV